MVFRGGAQVMGHSGFVFRVGCLMVIPGLWCMIHWSLKADDQERWFNVHSRGVFTLEGCKCFTLEGGECLFRRDFIDVLLFLISDANLNQFAMPLQSSVILYNDLAVSLTFL